jgi:hypothetical protein
MTDSRSARKAAERAAQALLEGTLISKAGDLGAAAAARTEAADGVKTARERGTELLADAQRQADTLLTDAQSAVTAADTAYADAWQAATAAGWTEQALTDLGYPPPDTGPKRRRRPTTGKASKESQHSPAPGSGHDGQTGSDAQHIA